MGNTIPTRREPPDFAKDTAGSPLNDFVATKSSAGKAVIFFRLRGNAVSRVVTQPSLRAEMQWKKPQRLPVNKGRETSR